jgi:hypothetical protein
MVGNATLGSAGEKENLLRQLEDANARQAQAMREVADYQAFLSNQMFDYGIRQFDESMAGLGQIITKFEQAVNNMLHPAVDPNIENLKKIVGDGAQLNLNAAFEQLSAGQQNMTAGEMQKLAATIMLNIAKDNTGNAYADINKLIQDYEKKRSEEVKILEDDRNLTTQRGPYSPENIEQLRRRKAARDPNDVLTPQEERILKRQEWIEKHPGGRPNSRNPDLAPMFKSGGFTSQEIPAVLHKGEFVFSREATKGMANEGMDLAQSNETRKPVFMQTGGYIGRQTPRERFELATQQVLGRATLNGQMPISSNTTVADMQRMGIAMINGQLAAALRPLFKEMNPPDVPTLLEDLLDVSYSIEDLIRQTNILLSISSDRRPSVSALPYIFETQNYPKFEIGGPTDGKNKLGFNEFPIIAHAGEFVVNAEAVDGLAGYGFDLNASNQQKKPVFMKTGGSVGGTYKTPTATPTREEVQQRYEAKQAQIRTDLNKKYGSVTAPSTPVAESPAMQEAKANAQKTQDMLAQFKRDNDARDKARASRYEASDSQWELDKAKINAIDAKTAEINKPREKYAGLGLSEQDKARLNELERVQRAQEEQRQKQLDYSVNRQKLINKAPMLEVPQWGDVNGPSQVPVDTSILNAMTGRAAVNMKVGKELSDKEYSAYKTKDEAQAKQRREEWLSTNERLRFEAAENDKVLAQIKAKKDAELAAKAARDAEWEQRSGWGKAWGYSKMPFQFVGAAATEFAIKPAMEAEDVLRERQKQGGVGGYVAGIAANVWGGAGHVVKGAGNAAGAGINLLGAVGTAAAAGTSKTMGGLAGLVGSEDYAAQYNDFGTKSWNLTKALGTDALGHGTRLVGNVYGAAGNTINTVAALGGSEGSQTAALIGHEDKPYYGTEDAVTNQLMSGERGTFSEGMSQSGREFLNEGLRPAAEFILSAGAASIGKAAEGASRLGRLANAAKNTGKAIANPVDTAKSLLERGNTAYMNADNLIADSAKAARIKVQRSKMLRERAKSTTLQEKAVAEEARIVRQAKIDATKPLTKNELDTAKILAEEKRATSQSKKPVSLNDISREEIAARQAANKKASVKQQAENREKLIGSVKEGFKDVFYKPGKWGLDKLWKGTKYVADRVLPGARTRSIKRTMNSVLDERLPKNTQAVIPTPEQPPVSIGPQKPIDISKPVSTSKPAKADTAIVTKRTRAQNEIGDTSPTLTNQILEDVRVETPSVVKGKQIRNAKSLAQKVNEDLNSYWNRIQGYWMKIQENPELAKYVPDDFDNIYNTTKAKVGNVSTTPKPRKTATADYERVETQPTTTVVEAQTPKQVVKGKKPTDAEALKIRQDAEVERGRSAAKAAERANDFAPDQPRPITRGEVVEVPEQKPQPQTAVVEAPKPKPTTQVSTPAKPQVAPSTTSPVEVGKKYKYHTGTDKGYDVKVADLFGYEGRSFEAAKESAVTRYRDAIKNITTGIPNPKGPRFPNLRTKSQVEAIQEVGSQTYRIGNYEFEVGVDTFGRPGSINSVTKVGLEGEAKNITTSPVKVYRGTHISEPSVNLNVKPGSTMSDIVNQLPSVRKAWNRDLGRMQGRFDTSTILESMAGFEQFQPLIDTLKQLGFDPSSISKRVRNIASLESIQVYAKGGRIGYTTGGKVQVPKGEDTVIGARFGEYVLKKPTVDKLQNKGYDLDAINQTGEIQTYADGGAIGYRKERRAKNAEQTYNQRMRLNKKTKSKRDSTAITMYTDPERMYDPDMAGSRGYKMRLKKEDMRTRTRIRNKGKMHPDSERAKKIRAREEAAMLAAAATPVVPPTPAPTPVALPVPVATTTTPTKPRINVRAIASHDPPDMTALRGASPAAIDAGLSALPTSKPSSDWRLPGSAPAISTTSPIRPIPLATPGTQPWATTPIGTPLNTDDLNSPNYGPFSTAPQPMAGYRNIPSGRVSKAQPPNPAEAVLRIPNNTQTTPTTGGGPTGVPNNISIQGLEELTNFNTQFLNSVQLLTPTINKFSDAVTSLGSAMNKLAEKTIPDVIKFEGKINDGQPILVSLAGDDAIVNKVVEQVTTLVQGMLDQQMKNWGNA